MWFAIIPLLLMLVPDVYIWHFFVRNFNPSILLKILYWLPLTIAGCTVVASVIGLHQMWLLKLFFFVFLCLALPKLIFMLISLVGKGGGLVVPTVALWADILGVALALVMVGMSIYGMTYGWKKFTVTEVAISSPLIPTEFNGYRIVQLSDLHIGTFAESPEAVDDLVAKVNQLQPDVVLFTGDLVNSAPEELTEFLEPLSGIQARDGVYSVLGNHDYCLYQRYDNPRDQILNQQRIVELQEQMNWKLLMNENVSLQRDGAEISLIGVENAGRPPFPSHSDLKKAMVGVPDNSFKILMTHDPTHWRREVLDSTDIQLSLAGHTHAMQFKILGFSPSRWAYDEWAGLYTEKQQQLYINHGTGGNMPFRFGAWPEITLITLNKAH